MSGLANAEVNQRLRLDEFLKPTTCENAKQPWPKSSLCNECLTSNSNKVPLKTYIIRKYNQTLESMINGINAVVFRFRHAMGTGPHYNLFLC